LKTFYCSFIEAMTFLAKKIWFRMTNKLLSSKSPFYFRPFILGLKKHMKLKLKKLQATKDKTNFLGEL